MPGQGEALAHVNRAKGEARRLEAEHRAVLAARWVDAWRVLAPEYESALTDVLSHPDETGWVSARALRASRLEQALDHTKDQLSALVDGDVVDARAYTLPIMQTMVDGDNRALTAQLPPEAQRSVVVWDRMDPDQLDAIVERTAGQITARSMPLPEDVTVIIGSELTRGVAVGDNPRAVARRMTRQAGARFDGGRARALNIARTEMLDAAREAQRRNDVANASLLAGWTWQAALDARCCGVCAAMHGTQWPATEPGPHGHPSCRCARVPVAVGWGALGIPGLDGGTEWPIPEDEGEAWFHDLDAGTQQIVMGSKARRDAVLSGELPWSEIAVRRPNTGWRDSYGYAT